MKYEEKQHLQYYNTRTTMKDEQIFGSTKGNK